ncbi:hypothetical protein J2W42_002262 [Rhizobium tibeticum]|uniref:Uncharacterized protein n=1 Tax=Rhizobium tibeticum TaxID=501024 RepID=A0A1H8M5S7_9HYPH|nr:hypothetical protein [Rhizobium tibeticum]SEH94005.1 hypothetical protein RTCCBAU85039_3215 [Rhizobium tibeticum]SEO12689.1 hypothetical protein SAMN05216228_101228 [Rhizobium tibeticum]
MHPPQQQQRLPCLRLSVARSPACLIFTAWLRVANECSSASPPFVIAREVYSVDSSTHCTSLTGNDDCSGFMEVDE